MTWINELAADHSRAAHYGATTPHTSYPGGVLHWSGMAVDSIDIPEPPTRILKCTEVRRIRAVIHRKGVSVRKFSDMLGYSDTAVFGWVATNRKKRRLVSSQVIKLMMDHIDRMEG